MPSVRFFIPREEWPVSMPSGADDFWRWALATESLKYTYGRYVSTLRTYLELQANGFPCELIDAVPQDGIIVTHVDFLPHTAAEEPWNRLPVFEQWLEDAFIVCYQGDRPRYPYADIRVVQNRADALGHNLPPLVRRIRPRLLYLPYWTQPGLLARDPGRGDEFVNIAFFGDPGETDPSLTDPAWVKRMASLGFRFQVCGITAWHDYREVDAVLAVRSFGYRGTWLRKPPTKLFNAWLAEVPAVLGPESAYRAERESELDYIEVRSRDDLEMALLRLRDDRDLRAAMVEQGRRRSEQVNARALAGRWQELLETQAYPAYERWRRSSRLARRVSRWEGSARTRGETALQTLMIARRRSRDMYRHRRDWN